MMACLPCLQIVDFRISRQLHKENDKYSKIRVEHVLTATIAI